MIRKFIQSLTPLGLRVIGVLVLALVILGLFTIRSCQQQSVADTKTELSQNQTEAAIASGVDAVDVVGEQSGREATIDRQTKENTDAIRNAPGADTPVPPTVAAVARERLCQRATYRERPECLQYAPAK
jgi:ABC-type Na+ efflux pump permease subunit